MNLPYVFYLTIIAAIIFLIIPIFTTRNGALIINFISMGPSGYRIPYGLLQELGLTNKKLSKIRGIKKDLIAFAIFSLAFGSLSLDTTVTSSKILNAIIHIASVITVAAGFVKLIVGIDIGVKIIKDPDQEIIDRIIDYLNLHDIKIKSMLDFEKYIDHFMHLLPVVDNEEKKLFIQVNDADLNLKTDEDFQALKRMRETAQFRNPIIPNKSDAKITKAKPKKSKKNNIK